MATIQEIKELALHAAKGTVPSTFSKEDSVDVNAALRDCLKDYAGSINQFMIKGLNISMQQKEDFKQKVLE